MKQNVISAKNRLTSKTDYFNVNQVKEKTKWNQMNHVKDKNSFETSLNCCTK